MGTEEKDTEVKQKSEESEQFLTDFAQMVKEEFSTKRHKDRVKGLRGRKKLMVEALISKFGIVSDACRSINLPHRTHYNWLNDDPIYKEACKGADLVLKDLGEKALIGLIAEKNPQAVLHFNKTKNRDRGYGEHLTTEEVGNKEQKIILEIVHTNDTKNKDNESLSTIRGSEEPK
jgi:hypothetical protein